MWVGGYYHYVVIRNQQIFLTKELDKHARRASICCTPLQKGSFGCYAVDRHICDLLSENPALCANIEFKLVAILSVQVVS